MEATAQTQVGGNTGGAGSSADADHLAPQNLYSLIIATNQQVALLCAQLNQAFPATQGTSQAITPVVPVVPTAPTQGNTLPALMGPPAPVSSAEPTQVEPGKDGGCMEVDKRARKLSDDKDTKDKDTKEPSTKTRRKRQVKVTGRPEGSNCSESIHESSVSDGDNDGVPIKSSIDEAEKLLAEVDALEDPEVCLLYTSDAADE